MQNRSIHRALSRVEPWLIIVLALLAVAGYQLTAYASVGGSEITSNASIPVSIAYMIDKKIDDGLPTSGNTQALYLNYTVGTPGAVNSSPNDSATSCYNTSQGTYSIGYNGGSGANCALSIRFQ